MASTLNRLVTTLILSFIIISAPSAVIAQVVDLGELQNGVPTPYPGDFKEIQATFTALETGPLRMTCSGTAFNAYSDSAHTKELTGEFGYVNNQSMRVYKVNKGDRIYLYNFFSMDAGEITVVNGTIPVKLHNTRPSTDSASEDYYGGKFSISTNYIVQFNFNVPVKISGARMLVGGKSTSLSADAAGSTVEVTVHTGIIDKYRSGEIKEGDTVRIEVLDVREKDNESNIYGTDGTASVEYVMHARPTELVSSENTPNANGLPRMLSYYMADNDAARLRFTFSGPMSSAEGKTAIGRLTYGNIDIIEAGMYVEEIPATVDGNTVTVDLSGKRRRPEDMLPLLAEADRLPYIAFQLRNMYDANGQRIYTGVRSNPVSLSYSFGVETLQYNIASDYTPAVGQTLAQGDAMEIYIMGGEKLIFDGVEFSYTDTEGKPATVIVGKDQLNVAPDKDFPTDILITLTVPALPGISGQDVAVSLAGMVCADGLDHSADIQASFGYSGESGVEGVAVDTRDSRIYNAQGQLMPEGTQLPAGLYIGKGRKFMVK